MELCAVILAAGQGTRMKSSLPKVLHEVLGRTMIGWAVQAARDAGAKKVVVVVGHGREAVEASLRQREAGEDLHFVVQAEQRGTAHAVQQAEPALRDHQGHVLILSGDVPNLRADTLKALVRRREEAGVPLSFLSCHVPDPTGYGRVVRDAQGKPLRNVEHRDATEAERAITEINAAFYCVDNAFLWAHLGSVGTQNDQQEYYLPDLLAIAREHGGLADLVVPQWQELEGVNTRAQLAKAEEVARERRNEALMISGVTMREPSTIRVEHGVTLDPDVTLEGGVTLRGRTHLASGVVVQQGCIVEDSRLEQGVLLKPYSHVEGSLVRSHAQVGPFAHLRPQSDIGPKARVGNFVEIKKSTLGEGTKANHLTYLGDAVIGKNCNIGAGTITCNYDGVHKHQTTMGDGVFIGSNAALVAPITLGDEAYVGAGSVITNDVPSLSLAVARGRQTTFEGWVSRKKALGKKGGEGH
jgi:bifunctional UDP-N-acetylglucosamine pyrophosphorylase/glucosamine-1-phosphate N-acetyltransferase